MQLELAELEIFRAVAKEQSVTRAARVLQRVQSNVTTRVRQLEEDLGVPLFLRDSKRMTLTPEGHRFLDYAERILALTEEARQAMHSGMPTGRLRLGTMEAAAASRLPAPLARFHEAWPAVEIEIHTGTTQGLADAVAEHRLDCAVVAHPAVGKPEDADMEDLGPGLQGSFLFAEKLMLVSPPGHARIRRAGDVRVRNIAAFARGCTYRQCVQDWLAEDGDSLAKWNVIELTSYDAILACVMAGTAVAAFPQSVLDIQRIVPRIGTTFMRSVNSFLIRRAGFETLALKEITRELKRKST